MLVAVCCCVASVPCCKQRHAALSRRCCCNTAQQSARPGPTGGLCQQPHATKPLQPVSVPPVTRPHAVQSACAQSCTTKPVCGATDRLINPTPGDSQGPATGKLHQASVQQFLVAAVVHEAEANRFVLPFSTAATNTLWSDTQRSHHSMLDTVSPIQK